MRILYDPEADAVAIHLVEGMSIVDDTEVVFEAAGELLVELDRDRRILGFSILGARKMLPAEVLEGAERHPD